MQDFIKVCVRLRPLATWELMDGGGGSGQGNDRRQSMIPQIPRKTAAVVDKQMLVFDPSDVNKGFVKGVPTHDNRRTKDIQYVFDRVFDEHATQEDVYKDTVANLLDVVMDGINATIFAYGATGAGKTYTGSPDNPGIMPLCMRDLFEKIEQSRLSNIVDLTVSYLEVYNETIRDLLSPSDTLLDLREDASNNVVVAGLSEHHPSTYDDLVALLQIGCENRTQSSTKANEASSRSHAVFQITIQQREKASGISTCVKSSTLIFCDLAGSERASVTDNKGKQLREGANINRSLLALGNCINALCENNIQHVPYRDSKLTRILKHSLGGNCKTVMIANISPAISHYEETHNTLKYAARTKKIRQSAVKNEVNVQFHIGQYTELIETLRKENQELKDKLTQGALVKSYLWEYLKEATKETLLSGDDVDKVYAFVEKSSDDSELLRWTFDHLKTLSHAIHENSSDLKQVEANGLLSLIGNKPNTQRITRSSARKQSRRKSMIPLFDPKRSAMKTRRQSQLPVPNSSLKRKAKTELEDKENNTTPKAQKLLDDLSEIDFFLDTETPKARKAIEEAPNSVTPKPRQRVLRSSSELRTFVNENISNSPKVGAIPFSPAQQKSKKKNK